MHFIPPIPLNIDWKHSISKGLLDFGYCLNGRLAFSAFRKAQPFVTGTGTPSASKHGRAINVSGAGNYINLGRNIASPSEVASGFVLTRVNSLAAASILLTTANQSGLNYVGHWFNTETTGAISANYGDNTGVAASSRRTASTAAGVVAAGETFSAGFVCRAATNWSLYKNGVSLTPTYGGTTNAYSAGTANGTVNFRAAGAPYGDQAASLWAFWGRALSNAEMQMLARDPWILLARPRLVYKAPAAGGADVRRKIIPAYMRLSA